MGNLSIVVRSVQWPCYYTVGPAVSHVDIGHGGANRNDYCWRSEQLSLLFLTKKVVPPPHKSSMLCSRNREVSLAKGLESS